MRPFLFSVLPTLIVVFSVLPTLIVGHHHHDAGSSSNTTSGGTLGPSSYTINGVKVGTSGTSINCINQAKGITVKPDPNGTPLQLFTFVCPGVMLNDILPLKVTRESLFEAAAWGVDHGTCCVSCNSGNTNTKIENIRQLFILQAAAVEYKFNLTSWNNYADGPMQKRFCEWMKGDGSKANTSPTVSDIRAYCPSVFDNVKMTTEGSLYAACVEGFTHAAQCAAYGGTPLPDVSKLANAACSSRYVPDN